MKDINGGHRGYECTGREFDDEKYEPHKVPLMDWVYGIIIVAALLFGMYIWCVGAMTLIERWVG